MSKYYHQFKACLKILIFTTISTPISGVHAGIKYGDSQKFIQAGGLIQLQYTYKSPQFGSNSDDLSFSVLRPYIKGSMHPEWNGKIEWSLESDAIIEDAYLEYTGNRYLGIKIGNAKFPFSRELITPLAHQQSSSRTLVGNTNYGTSGRQIGLHLDNMHDYRTLIWHTSIAQAGVDTRGDNQIKFISLANNKPYLNQGWLIGGRLDWFPNSYFDFSQGDFDGRKRSNYSIAFYRWGNDGDNITVIHDVDNIIGFELSAGWRSNGWSIDMQYNRFRSQLISTTYNGGLYQNGETALTNMAIEGGFIFSNYKYELIANYQSQNAETYIDNWQRMLIGTNRFFHQHDIKLQIAMMYDQSIDGQKNSDLTEFNTSLQILF